MKQNTWNNKNGLGVGNDKIKTNTFGSFTRFFSVLFVWFKFRSRGFHERGKKAYAELSSGRQKIPKGE
jgi:hypothetical protein